jgi:hypothetical protein
LNGNFNVEASVNNLITDSADKLNVNGTVNLAGSTLNLTTLTAFTGPVSRHAGHHSETMGADAVTGTFATINSNNPNFQFTVNYAYSGPGGGDGNDVALVYTYVPEPGAAGAVRAGAGRAGAPLEANTDQGEREMIMKTSPRRMIALTALVLAVISSSINATVLAADQVNDDGLTTPTAMAPSRLPPRQPLRRLPREQ